MRKYTVVIEETVVDEFDIEALNEEEALKIAREKYRSGALVLEPGEVQGKQMSLRTSSACDPIWVAF